MTRHTSISLESHVETLLSSDFARDIVTFNRSSVPGTISKCKRNENCSRGDRSFGKQNRPFSTETRNFPRFRVPRRAFADQQSCRAASFAPSPPTEPTEFLTDDHGLPSTLDAIVTRHNFSSTRIFRGPFSAGELSELGERVRSTQTSVHSQAGRPID